VVAEEEEEEEGEPPCAVACKATITGDWENPSCEMVTAVNDCAKDSCGDVWDEISPGHEVWADGFCQGEDVEDEEKLTVLEQEVKFCAEGAAVCDEMTDACFAYLGEGSGEYDYYFWEGPGCQESRCDCEDEEGGDVCVTPASFAEKCPLCVSTITQLSKKCTASKVVEIKVKASMEVAGLTADTIPAADSPAMELLADSLAATIAKSITAAPGSTVEVISIGGVMVGGGNRRLEAGGAEIVFEVSPHEHTPMTYTDGPELIRSLRRCEPKRGSPFDCLRAPHTHVATHTRRHTHTSPHTHFATHTRRHTHTSPHTNVYRGLTRIILAGHRPHVLRQRRLRQRPDCRRRGLFGGGHSGGHGCGHQ